MLNSRDLALLKATFVDGYGQGKICMCVCVCACMYVLLVIAL